MDFDLEIDDQIMREIGTITNRRAIKESVNKFLKLTKETRVVQKIYYSREMIEKQQDKDAKKEDLKSNDIGSFLAHSR